MSQSTTCRSCGAPLAPDQRYCLACGTRVAAPRLDFLAEMERSAAAERAAAAGAAEAAGAGAPAALPGAAGGQPAPSKLDRVGGPMGVAAVLIVALGVGFLIGQGGDAQPIQQRAPVVNITGGLPASGTAGTAGAGDAGTADAGATASDDGGSGGGGRGRRPVADDAAAVEKSTEGISKAPPRATGDINRLRAEPDTTATPGAPPPVDDEPAGGGTEAETIG